jgi:hypothetical protein
MSTDAARRETRAAVNRLILEAGGKFARVPIRGMPDITTMEPEPLAAVTAARAVELSARYLARRYIRPSREAGYSWKQIGEALGLRVTAIDPGDYGAGARVAELAYDYAAGEGERFTPRSVVWACPVCDGTVSDRGPEAGANPLDAEPGHADGCPRLAAAVAAHEAQWADGE